MGLHTSFICISLTCMSHVLTCAHMHGNSVKISRDGAAAAGDLRWESTGAGDSGWGTLIAGKKGTGPALTIVDVCPGPACPAEGKAPQMIQ